MSGKLYTEIDDTLCNCNNKNKTIKRVEGEGKGGGGIKAGCPHREPCREAGEFGEWRMSLGKGEKFDKTEELEEANTDVDMNSVCRLRLLIQ